MTKPDLANRLEACAVKIQRKIPRFEDGMPFNATELEDNKTWATQMATELYQLRREAFQHTGWDELNGWLRNSDLTLSFIKTYGEMKRASFNDAQELRKLVRGIKSSIPEDWLGIDTMSVPDAVLCLGVTTAHLYRLIAKGQIATLQGTKLPLKTSVESYLQRRQPNKKRKTNTPKQTARRTLQEFKKNTLNNIE
jgi:hypothetical protein